MSRTTGDIRVVMADDHEIFRDGFRLTLSKANDIYLVGEAADGKELLKQVEQQQPNVVITDIKMPRMDGIEATRQIVARWPNIGVIGLSMFDDEDLIIEMLEAGAKGYLLKNADKTEVIEAIKTVYHEEPYYCRHTSGKLAMMIAKSKYNPHHKKPRVEFSEKEVEIIQLICRELTNKEIGERLFLSVRTVEGYRLRILEKMGVKNSVGLVVYAMQHGLFDAKAQPN
jgi:DNA-binding NarL/FixJ family response regulator